MFCKNCGEKLSETAKFCKGCGEKTVPKPSASEEIGHSPPVSMPTSVNEQSSAIEDDSILSRENVADYVRYISNAKGKSLNENKIRKWEKLDDNELSKALEKLYVHLGISHADREKYLNVFRDKQHVQVESPNEKIVEAPVAPVNYQSNPVQPVPQTQQPIYVAPPQETKGRNTKWYILGGVALLLGLGFLFKDKIVGTKSENTEQVSNDGHDVENYDGSNDYPEEVTEEYSEPAQTWTADQQIRNVVNAEDNRNFDLFWSYFSPNVRRYWDVRYPSYSKLKKMLELQWGKKSYSANFVQSIDYVSHNTYNLHTRFEYQMKKSGKQKSVYSTVRYVFDDDGKVLEVYGL